MCLACDFCWLVDARQIFFPEQSKKMKANGFAMGVANKKRRLRSSRLPLSLESLIEDVDELLRCHGG